MYGHLSTLAEIEQVAGQLMGHLLDGETTPKEGTSLTVLGEDQVLIC